jgi:CubicO group peptidase (beta-lactamase class C family)
MVTRRAFAGSLFAAAAVRPEPVAELRAWLESQIETKVIPGVKVAAVLDDEPIVSLYLGTYCNRTGCGKLTEPNAIHALASVSKMATATAVVMAWQDGLIDLDAPVVKYIPEFGVHGKQAVTVRMCLNHSAGIPTTIPGKWMDTDEHWNETLALVCAKEPEWEPGSRTQYHASTGQMIAAECVRRTSGRKSWHAICRERVFEPLGLKTMSFELPPADGPVVLHDPVKDYTEGASIYRRSVNNPGAGLMGTVADVLGLLRFHTREGVWNGKRLLGERYWREMHANQFPGKPAATNDKPGFESWGLGMMVRPEKGLGNTTWLGTNPRARRVFSHAGISTALAVGDPDRKLEIAIITTGVPATRAAAGEIRRRSIDAVYAGIDRG